MSSTQRFLSVAIGEGNTDNIKKIFNSSILLHFTMGIIIVVILEIAGILLLEGNILNIPKGRESIAMIVFHIMVATTFITIISAPYNATINSHEDMWYFAIIEIIACILKLCIIWGFTHIKVDSLVLYTIWILIITIFSYVSKLIWCRIKYPETSYRPCEFKQTKQTMRSMMGFIGWNTMGSFAVILRNQGVAIILNIFFTTTINAVYGIANQVSSQLSYFSQMLTTSMTPQIMKSKGENNTSRLIFLSCLTSKFSYFLSAIFAIPLIVNIDFILRIWLGNVPEFADYYCVTSILIFLIMQLYPGLNRAIQADGRIKQYNVWLTIIMLTPIFVSAILFSLGISHKAIMILMIIAQIGIMFMTLKICKDLLDIDIRKYLRFITQATSIFVVITYICIMVKDVLVRISDWYSLLITIVISSLSLCITFYFIILSGQERCQLKKIIKK